MKERRFRRSLNIDSLTLGIYFLMVLLGWMTIYSVSSSGGEGEIFDFSTTHGKQLIWMGIAVLLGGFVLAIDFRLFKTLAYVAYGGAIALLILTIFVGEEINGAKAWLVIGGQPFQPAEFAKIATALALSRYMSTQGFSISNFRQLAISAGMVILPAIIVIFQNDTGSALVFGSFILVFFREGLSPLLPILLIFTALVIIFTLYLNNFLYILLGLLLVGAISFLITYNIRYLMRNILIHVLVLAFFGGLSFGAQTLFQKLPPHQQNRILVWFNPKADPFGAGYNVIQSKIAIGSGHIYGKGYLDGNYTKYRFVPKQETDFIYCTIGEELGWVGSTFVIILFFVLLARLQFMAENGKMRFTRIYGYSCMSIIFFHVLVNVGMTIGFIPVIGIPLPFFSYGGSAMISFTLLLFVMINLYAHRGAVLSRSL